MDRLKEEAAQRSVTLSEWVRYKLGVQSLGMAPHVDDRDDQLGNHERRISRLEEMAGL